jgi:hypothetical protein
MDKSWGLSRRASVHQTGVDDLKVASLALFDDAYRLLGIKKPIDLAAAWLFEILVVLPIVLGFLAPVVS